MNEPQPTSGDGVARQSTTTDEELQRSSRAFLADLAELEEMEVRKAAMAPGDPERPNLARAIEDKATILLGRSAYQRRLAIEGFHQSEQEIPPRRAHAVLADWRDAERRLMEARSALERAIDDADRFRVEYRAAFDATRQRYDHNDGG
jgi:hypothetical protein